MRSIRAFLADDMAKRLLSGGALAALIKIASAAAAYVMLVVLARLMSPDEYGRFAFGLSLALTLSFVFSFGLPVASLRFWPQHNVKSEQGLARSFVAHGFSAVTIGAIICSGLFFVAATTITASNPSYSVDYWLVMAVLIALMAVAEFAQASLRADGAILLSMGPRDVGWRLLVIAVSLVAVGALPAFDAEQVLWIATACLAVTTLPQLIYARRRLQIGRADFAAKTEWPTWLRASWPMWGSAVLLALVQQFDVVLLGLFLGPEETGPYFAALRTASLIALLLFAANMVAAPLISKYHHSADHEGLRRMSRLLIVGITLPTLVGFLGLVVFGRWLLSVFDPAFADAYGLLVILGSGFAITALAGPVNYFLQMIGYERNNLRIQAAIYGGVVVVQCILVPLVGPMGAAIPSAIGAGLGAIWAVLLLRNRIGIDPSIIGLLWPVRDGSPATKKVPGTGTARPRETSAT